VKPEPQVDLGINHRKLQDEKAEKKIDALTESNERNLKDDVLREMNQRKVRIGRCAVPPMREGGFEPLMELPWSCFLPLDHKSLRLTTSLFSWLARSCPRLARYARTIGLVRV
jgi:hypothetical protein